MFVGRTFILYCGVSALFATAVAAQVEHSQGISKTGRLIREQLNLEDWEMRDIEMPKIPWQGGFDLSVEIEGNDYLLDLHPHRLRKEDCTVFELVNGEWVESLPPPEATYSGDLVDLESGVVVGEAWGVAESEDTINAGMRFEMDGSLWKLQPMRDIDPTALRTSHVLYHESWILPVDGHCGNDELFGNSQPPIRDLGDGDGGGIIQRDEGDEITDIAIDIDFDFYNWAGSTRKKAIRSVEKVMLDVDKIYERDVDATFEITYYVVRKSNGQDPYTTNDGGSLLGQVTNEWNANETLKSRDCVQLFSGRNFVGGVLGVAWVSTVCNTENAYSVVESSFTSNDVSRAALSAHEIGHMYNAGHCDGDSDCGIMCSGLGGCSGDLENFGTTATNQINSWINIIGCTETEGAEVAMPIFDDFEGNGSDLDNSIWTYNLRAAARKGGDNEPSGERSLKLNATGTDGAEQDDVRSNDIDTKEDTALVISFWWQDQDTTADEFIRPRFYAGGKNWNVPIKVFSDGINQSTYEFFTFDLVEAWGSRYLHKNFRFGFRPKMGSTGKFFVDDLSVSNTGFLHATDGGGGDDISGGRPIQFKLVGAPKNKPVVIYVGLEGIKKQVFRAHKGMELDLVGETAVIGQMMTDSTGCASLSLPIPPGTPQSTLYVQALVLDEDNPEATPPRQIQVKP